MIRPCSSAELETIREIINDGARSYLGVIPSGCWKEPYMSQEELRREVSDGVLFSGRLQGDELLGVMGIQNIQDVTLIRHAYVRTAWQRQGIGSELLLRLRRQTARPVLIGTWAAADWAVRFYQKHGFAMVPLELKDRLLRKYWSVPAKQIQASVVLADRRWFDSASRISLTSSDQ